MPVLVDLMLGNKIRVISQLQRMNYTHALER